VRDLEHSTELNDNRSIFRSRLQLDRDRAARSADLAAIYDAAGMTEVSDRAPVAPSRNRIPISPATCFSRTAWPTMKIQIGLIALRNGTRKRTARRESARATRRRKSFPNLSQQDHLQYFDTRHSVSVR